MIPKNPRAADRQYVIGEVYTLDVREDRSGPSHRQYFAAINDAWANLPDNLLQRFPSPEHLRAFSLIRAGYANSRQIVCANKTEARRVAAFVRPMNTYALVTVTDGVVTVYEAKSQSYRAMPKGEFQKSKDAVLDILARFLGTTSGELQDNAEAAA
jgi:hypothetical protein